MLYWKSIESIFELCRIGATWNFCQHLHVHIQRSSEKEPIENISRCHPCVSDLWSASMRCVSFWHALQYSAWPFFDSFQKPVRSRTGQQNRKKMFWMWKCLMFPWQHPHSSLLAVNNLSLCVAFCCFSEFLALWPPSSTRSAGFFWKVPSRTGLRDEWLRFQSQGIWASPRKTDLPNFREILCALPSRHSSLQGLLTLIFLVSSLFGATTGVCVRFPTRWRLRGRRQWIVKSGAGEKHWYSRRRSVSERGRVRRHSDEIRCSGASDPRCGGDTWCVTQQGCGQFLRSQTVWFQDEPLHTPSSFWNHLEAQRTGASSQNSSEDQNIRASPLKRLRPNCFGVSRTFISCQESALLLLFYPPMWHEEMLRD